MRTAATAEDASLGSQVFPGWLEDSLVPDSRFARAYNALGDSGRGLLKRVIAAHFALNPPAAARATTRLDMLRGGLSVASDAFPRAWAVILCDAGADVPAFLLPALLPALNSGVVDVLVARLGSGRGFSDSTLAACELAGQERVAALGARQAEALLAHLAATGLSGVVLHADTPAMRKLFSRPGLNTLLACSDIRREALCLPSQGALWRDDASDFPAETLSLLYGALPFEQGSQDALSFEDFAAARHELLLVPDGRLGHLFQVSEQGARVTVAASQLGLWTWNTISPEIFLLRSSVFSSDR